MISAVLSRLCILLFGTLYPAYASYKAVRTKNVKEYVKWMMYWIVFALFTCAETFTDVFLSWFPFYYEIKIILVFWLLSPATKGSSILYRKFVHPALCRREQEIDECISKAKEQGYHTVLNLGTKGVNYATSVIMQTAIRGGGGLVQQLRKSYSLSDLSVSDDHTDARQELDETDDVVADTRLVRRSASSRGRSPRPVSSPRVDMFFPEVDVNARSVGARDSVNLGHIRSSEDISSSYIPENLSSQDMLTRTASVGGSSRTRSKVTRSTFTSIKRPGAAEGNEVIIEEIDDDTDFIENPYDLSDIQNIQSTAVMPYFSNIQDLNSIDDNNRELIYQKYLQLKDLFDSNSKNVSNDTENQSKKEDESIPVINIDSQEHVVINDVINTIVDIPVVTDDDKNIENIIEGPKNVFLELNKLTEDSISIISSSIVSSDTDNSESEFNTPNSSPISSPKTKHKKRHAPPPPITVDNVTDPVLVQSEPIQKSKDKKSKDFLKLIPSKLAFWKSDDALNVDKSDGASQSSSSVYEDGDSLLRTNADKTMGDIISTFKKLSASLDSLNDQFLDASETDAKNAVIKIDDVEVTPTQHIPLKVDTFVTYTGSKSTDV